MKVSFHSFSQEYQERGDLYLKAIKNVLASGQYILGSNVEKFEHEFAKRIGAKYCIGVANGLEAIEIALMSHNISKNDEVITTPISAVATTLAILSVGAKPIFAEIDDKGMITAETIRKVATKKTKAVLPVDLYGNACEIEKIRKICNDHRLVLIEDAAQAHLAKSKTKVVGGLGHTTCFSFYPTKNLGAFGDAGAIVTNSKTVYKKAQKIRDYGQSAKYIHVLRGMNSRLDELQAAVLLEKINFLSDDNQARRKISDLYHQLLFNQKNISFIDPYPNAISARHLLVIKAKKRNQLQKYLLQHNVQTLIHYPKSIPSQPFLASSLKSASQRTADLFCSQVLSLPCNPWVTREEVKYISRLINNFYQS